MKHVARNRLRCFIFYVSCFMIYALALGCADTTADSENTQGDSENKEVRMNKLGKEVSPYLLQHADNPVAWQPWEKIAFEAAKEEDKPVFLSIGYSTCHWCHVMEHESFENEEIAEYLNKHFISIKVDREERPDIDDIYMKAVMEMNNGRGGWPLSVFLTPEGNPFFGGTYFPPDSFKQILERIVEVWNKEREKVKQQAGQFSSIMKINLNQPTAASETVGEDVINVAASQLKERYDATYGGFSSAPKFPTPTTLDTLLYRYYLDKDDELLGMLIHTANKMALGGIYDQAGGGFHRYSTDSKWLVPHFEKMLYDNAQLINFYLDMYRVTGDKFYLTISEDTADYLLREMRSGAGGYYSAQDADSEGIEGKYYSWTKKEIDTVLDPDEQEVFYKYFDITEEPNFVVHHGDVNFESNVLSLKKRIENPDLGNVRKIKQKLFKEREKRIKPHTDDKILTSWNSLLVAGFSGLYKVTRDQKYRDEAESIVKFINDRLVKEGKLYHSFAKDLVRTTGLLEDYSYFSRALFAVYEITFDEKYIKQALELTEKMVEIFYDRENDAFFDYDPKNPDYIYTLKDPYDGVTPAPNAVAVHVLQLAYEVTFREEYNELAEKTLGAFSLHLEKYPAAYVSLAMRFVQQKRGRTQVVIAADDPFRSGLVNHCYETYLPESSVYLFRGESALKLVGGKVMQDGKGTAYVCTGKTCLPPVTTVDGLKADLGGRD